MNESEALLVLNAIPGIGNLKISKLIEYMGSSNNVLCANKGALISTGVVNNNFVENILTFPKEDFLKGELGLMKEKGVKVVSYLDQEYPVLLKEIPDFPKVK